MKLQDKHLSTLLIALAVLVAAALVILDLPLDQGRSSLSYQGESIGSYYPASPSQGFALLLAEPEGSERYRLKPIIRLAQEADLPVLTLNLEEVDLAFAMEALSNTAGVEEEDILLAAYGRASQTLLEEAAYLEGGEAGAGLALFAPLTSPEAFEPGEITLPTLILGTTSDDVAPPEQLAQLYNSLSGDEILATGFGIKADQQDISLRIVSGVFHAHNTYSREITTAFSQWLWDTYAIQIPEVSPGSTVRPLLWAGLYLFWGLAMVFLYRQLSHSALEVSYSLLSVKGAPSGRYITRKSLYWQLALPLAAVIFGVLWLLPLELPLLSIAFLSWLAANAGLSCYLYRSGKMPGVSTLARPPLAPLGGKRVGLSLLLTAVTFLWGVVLARSGFMGWDASLPHWIAFAIALPICGLASGLFTYESLVMEEFKISLPVRIGVQRVQFLPLEAAGAFCGPINYWSGVLICGIGLATLWAVLLLCRVVQYLSGSLVTSGLCGGLLLAAFFTLAAV